MFLLFTIIILVLFCFCFCFFFYSHSLFGEGERGEEVENFDSPIAAPATKEAYSSNMQACRRCMVALTRPKASYIYIYFNFLGRVLLYLPIKASIREIFEKVLFNFVVIIPE